MTSEKSSIREAYDYWMGTEEITTHTPDKRIQILCERAQQRSEARRVGKPSRKVLGGSILGFWLILFGPLLALLTIAMLYKWGVI